MAKPDLIKTTMKKLDHVQTLRNRAFREMFDLLKKRNPEFPQPFLTSVLLTFIENKGVNAVLDLHGFYLYCVDLDHEDGYIWSQIMHDLNDRDTDFAVPRTAGYAKEYFKKADIV